MLCRNCGLRPATTHIKRVINGKVEEYHLCSQCAEKMNVSAFDLFNLSDLWGSFFGDRLPNEPSINQKRCQSCGSTFADIARLGKLGCPDCYSEFYDELLPSLRKIHGKTHHVGKVPNCADDKTKAGYEINDLKKELNEAITNEEYEKAAQIRDKIKLLEEKRNGVNIEAEAEQTKASDKKEDSENE